MRARLAEEEYDGEELVATTPKGFLRMLRGTGAEDAVPLLLAARDASLGGAPALPPEKHSCPICFEDYAQPAALPRMLGCGHTFCEPCLAKMLAPLLAERSAKRLACPSCRVPCAVPRGKAAALPTNFVALG